MIRGVISGASFLGLEESERQIAVELVRTLNEKWTRNILRRRYYEGHNALKDLGIAIPPPLTSVEVVVGWPAKVVDAMIDRTILQGFVSTSGSSAMNALLAEVWESNRLAVEIPAAHTSSLVHSCVFVFVSRGIVDEDEPEVVISAKSAEDAAAIWDPRRRRVRAALSVDERDPVTGHATMLHLFLPPMEGRPGRVMRLSPNTWGAMEAVEVSTFAGPVPVEALPYQPTLSRPFGRSRITRGTMYYTDAAMRTMLRTEVAAEFYNAPQRYAMGADEDAFTDANGNPVPAWTVMLGRLLTLSRDEDGELPEVGQFAQQSMQPNVEQLRSIAQMLASDASLDVGSLGIVQDNPSSAEAIRARNEELGVKIENWRSAVLSPSWRRILGHGARMVDGSAALESELSSISAQWGSWSAPSEVSQAQASAARVQAVPRLAETDVELEHMGFTADEIKRIRSDWNRTSGREALLSGLAQAQAVAPEGDAAALKAKFDALGMAIRAGVDPAAAAERLGLAGIKFTGAAPVSLRLPEDKAAELEGR